MPIAVLLADFIAKIVLHIYWFHASLNIKAWQIFEIVCGILRKNLSFCIGISIRGFYSVISYCICMYLNLKNVQ